MRIILHYTASVGRIMRCATYFFCSLVALVATVLPARADIITTTANYSVTHRSSYLYGLNSGYSDLPGLATQNFHYWDGSKGVQKVNEFKITHYLKSGVAFSAEFPTTYYNATSTTPYRNQHTYYQRFYNYDNETDVASLTARINTTTNNGSNNIRFYQYKNGLVTGQGIYWGNYTGTHYALHDIIYTNTDGSPFTLAVDVSLYTDYTYENPTYRLQGDMEEPSLNMRYIYYMRDAKEMANELTQLKLTGTPNAQTPTTLENELFYEEKEIHFPQIENQYRNSNNNQTTHEVFQGEFLGLRHTFADYWVYGNNNANANSDAQLINLANTNRIEVVVYPNGTGINLTGNENGYFLYNNDNLNVSRFLNFRYPAANALADGSRQIPDALFTAKGGTETEPAYVCCYLNNNGTRYKVAKFKIIFDKPAVGNRTQLWSQIRNTDRDPSKIREKAGMPIAKITFDNPTGSVYKTPSGATTIPVDNNTSGKAIANSGGTPLFFDNTNYAFDASDPYWGCYSLLTQITTTFTGSRTLYPSNHDTYGTGLPADPGMTRHFMYIDASEQPGDIGSVDFVGDFCSGDKLMCTGWIAGGNIVRDGSGMKIGDVSTGRCPGSVTLTVKGERKEPNGTTTQATIKRYNPGNIYSITYDGRDEWRQFYFEFSVDKHYDRYWLEVNNNSVSSQGADFFLDDIEVYCLTPEIFTENNAPLCVKESGSDLALLKLTADFNEMLEVKGQTELTGDNTYKNVLGLVFLNKEVFLKTFKEEIAKVAGYDSYGTMSLADFEDLLDKNYFENAFDAAYQTAFDAALLGNKEVWDSDSGGKDDGHCVMNFHWDRNFSKMPTFNFVDAMNKTSPVYGSTDSNGRRIIIFNGNYPGLDNWEPNVEYYIVTYNERITDISFIYSDFDLREECTKRKTFHLKPQAELLAIEEKTHDGDLEVCEGKIPTVLTDLKGLKANGEEVPLTNLNFDWWIGDPKNGILATLKNYHTVKYDRQPDGTYTTSTAVGAPGVTLGSAISAFRALYMANTNLIGVVPKSDALGSVEVTQEHLDLLNYLVQKGQLFLHSKSASVVAEPVSPTEPYFYLVASPIHDDTFTSQLNDPAKAVMYYCEEPQGLRMRISEKAPTVSNGFANGSNGIDTYNYPVELRTLSLRLAKRAQFDVVRHGSTSDVAIADADVDAYLAGSRDSLLFLPLRDASAPSTGATKVITKATDENIYLSMSDDPKANNLINTTIRNSKTLPVVGRVVQLRARDKSKIGSGTDDSKTFNRLVIYFFDSFEVHEGYNYTLSMPFREDVPSNACDGTLLMHLKIVPDYQVWTGLAPHTAAQSPDWSNDANWRRADADELLLEKFDGSSDYRDPNPNRESWNTPALIDRHTYLTNDQNYQSDLDKVTRKGYSPLYCTHILMRTNESTDVPQLYDRYDGYTEHETPGDDTSPLVPALKEAPFPNLRPTATDILKFDMQARDYDSWKIVHGTSGTSNNPPAGSKRGDQIAEMYETNVCDEIVFQPRTELLYAQHLTYNKAWVEYALEKDSWQLVSSPLQGMISGEWYAPTGTAQQKTTYYEPVEFVKDITKYDRFSPAVYQRSWDKAKAVFYDRGAIWSSTDGSQTDNLGSYNTGTWGTAPNSPGSAFTWIADQNADDYLQRLSYRPMGDSKANVAMKGTWSNVFNDHTVSYDQGGFSVLVINSHKGNDTTPGEKSLFRLPKEDYYYDIWDWRQSYVEPRRVRVYMDDGRPFPAGIESDGNYSDPITTANTLSLKDDDGKSKRGRLRSDAFKKSGEYSVALANEGGSNLGYFLVGNPFICGLNVADMMANASNSGKVNTSVTITTDAGQEVYSYTNGHWELNGVAATPIVPQGQAFFLQVPSTATDKNNLSLTFTPEMMTTAPRASNDSTGGNGNNGNEPGGNNDPTGGNGNNGNNGGNPDGNGTTNPVKPFATRAAAVEQPTSLVITASRGHRKSTAVVKCSEGAENAFVENEDVPMFVEESVMDAPTIYTLCGRLATSVNRLRDFRVLPIGIESNSNDMVTVSFNGVEAMGDSLQLYDAQTGELMPLQSGTTTTMPGQTMNRYYIISGTYQSELVSESRLQIYCDDRQVTVQTSGGEYIRQVNAYDPAGRRVYSAAPQSVEHHFTLTPGVYLIEAKTDACRKAVKVAVK